jgi:hypothetical protein
MDDLWRDAYYGGVALVFVSPLAYGFIPIVRDIMSNNDIVAFGIYLMQNVAPIFVAWKK